MREFFIVTNPEKDRGLQLTGILVRYLESHGCRCLVHQAEGKADGAFHYTDPELIPDGVQCILVLGGDGTLLQTARDVVRKGIPLIGINLGQLGFLAEVDSKNIYPALDRLIRDDCETERRMMLQGTIYRGMEAVGEDIALNDIVITRNGHMRVVRFHNYINNEFLNSYDADGVIISTPTGSTGYSLSAGGPIVSPNARMMIMTPVAPHTLSSRSIIFPAEDILTVEIGPSRRGGSETAMAAFDGDTEIAMTTGDRIQIRAAREEVRILKLSHLSFLETLRGKMTD